MHLPKLGGGQGQHSSLGDDIYFSMYCRSKTKIISYVLLCAVTFIFWCYGIRKFGDSWTLTLLVFQMIRYRCLTSVLGYMMQIAFPKSCFH